MFVPNNQTAATSNNQARGNFEPAVSFINLYLPSKDGGRTKLGAIPLKASNDRQKALHDHLADPANTEAVIKAIISRLEIDFQLADQGEGKHFDLGLDLPTKSA